MGWPMWKNLIVTFSVISALALFGLGKTFGIDITQPIYAGITWLHLLGAMQVVTIIAFWKRYI